jgi:bacteriorhodopsin
MFAAMMIVTLIFILMTIRVRKPLRLFHYITILITLTSCLEYFLMAAGAGWKFALVNIVHFDDGPKELVFRQIYWVRYVGWLITTPLILIDLTVLAGLPGAEILLAVYADLAMIIFVCPLFMVTNII